MNRFLKSKLLIYYIIISFTYSCEGEKKEKGSIYINKEYFPNGNIRKIEMFNGVKKNGYSRYFNESGILVKKVCFKNGIPNGEGWSFYKNGIVKSYFYYLNGNLSYRRNYSNKGFFNYDEGNGIIFSKINQTNYSKNDLIIDSITIVHPQNCKIEMSLTSVDENGIIKNLNKLPLNSNNLVIHREKILEDKLFHRKYILNLMDTITGKRSEYYYGLKIPLNKR